MQFHITKLLPSFAAELTVIMMAFGVIEVSQSELISATVLYFVSSVWWVVTAGVFIKLLRKNYELGVNTGSSIADIAIIILLGILVVLPITLLSFFGAHVAAVAGIYFFGNILVSVLLLYVRKREKFIFYYEQLMYKLFWFYFPVASVSVLAFAGLYNTWMLEYFIVAIFLILMTGDIFVDKYIKAQNI